MIDHTNNYRSSEFQGALVVDEITLHKTPEEVCDEEENVADENKSDDRNVFMYLWIDVDDDDNNIIVMMKTNRGGLLHHRPPRQLI